MTTYLFVAMTYRNWQRPGAAVNTTLAEAKAAKIKVEGENSYLVVHASHHKTAATYGPAQLILEGQDIEIFLLYREHVRSQLKSSLPNFLLTGKGVALTHYTPLVNQLAKQLGVSIPSATR